MILLIGCSPAEEKVVNVQVQDTGDVPQNSEDEQPRPKVECIADSDCGERRIENAYCFQTNPVGDIYEWKCENAGTPDAKCVEISKQGIIDECSDTEFCRKGECVRYADCQETDDGLDFETKGKVTTNDLAVYEDRCKSGSELIEYYCSSDDRAFSESHFCNCEKGACVTE